MADLTALKTAVDSLVAATSAALTRIAEDVEELKRQIAEGNSVTQADLDALTGKVQGVIATLAAADPIPDFPPAPPVG